MKNDAHSKEKKSNEEKLTRKKTNEKIEIKDTKKQILKTKHKFNI